MREFEIVKVTWFDSAHYQRESQLDWFIDNARTTEFSTVGFLLKSDTSIVVVAHDINEDDQGRNVSVIPKVLIKCMETLVREEL